MTWGTNISWFLSNAPRFSTQSTPLAVPELSVDEIKWIGSTFYIGAFVGTIFLAFMGDGFGKKNTMAAMIIPQLVYLQILIENHKKTNFLKKKFIFIFTCIVTTPTV